ncbi:G-protein coupled receptor family C group 6 member A-like [Hydractinia symbiolongicarpus]|uniref:G-protein coupled receptor family C group 6 member A-like n=1 Tax=Hydractinia symbiolongicarpus TaxID=13093 RepID=UPI00254A7B38|nr:G-protein coupled receptor family C group 6 member A-like [Hydractinia symbiolongicarpus]
MIFHALCLLSYVTPSDVLPVIIQPGDIYIIGIYSITFKNQAGHAYDKAALFNHLVVKDILQDENEVLTMVALSQNSTKMQVGYMAYNVAGNQTKLAEIMASILLDKQFRIEHKLGLNKNQTCNCDSSASIYNIVAVISLVSSQLNKLVSELLVPYKILLLGYKDKFSTFERYSQEFPLFLLMEKHYDQALSFIHMINHFQWEKVALVSVVSETEESNEQIDNVIKLLSQNYRRICFVVEQIPMSKMDSLMSKLQNTTNIDIVYMIGNGLDTFTFLYELDKRKIYGKTLFVAGSYMLTTAFLSFISNRITRGLYFTRMDMQKHYGHGDVNIFDDIWVQHLVRRQNIEKRSLAAYSKTENLTAPSFLQEFLREILFQVWTKGPNISDIQNGTNLFVQSNKHFGNPYIMTNIKSPNQKAIFSTLDIPDDLMWPGEYKYPPSSKCMTTECSPGTEPRIGDVHKNNTYWQKERKWLCVPCKTNYVKISYGLTKCRKCIGEYVSNRERTKCVDPYEDFYLKSEDTIMIWIYSLCCIECCLLLFMAVLFSFYQHTPVIRASDYKMTMLQLAVYFLISILSITFFVGQPKLFTCRYRSLIVGLLLTCAASITLVKTQRAFYLFKLRRRMTKDEVRMTKAGCWLVIVLFCSIELVIGFVHLLHETISVHEKLERNSMRRNIYCSSEKHLQVQIGLALITSLLCVIQGFRARHLPENFNETKYITFSTFTSTLILLTLFPLHYSQQDNRGKTVVNVFVLLVTNLVCFCIMHVKKVVVLLIYPSQNTIQAFQESRIQAVKDQVHEEININ